MGLNFIKTFIAINFIFCWAISNAQVNLSISVNPSEPVVLTGNPFFYNINFAITSPNVPGNNVVIRDTLPAYVEYKGIANSSLISSSSFNSTSRILTINLINPIPAGTSGSFQINCAFKKLVTPNNLQATNKVSISASNANSSPVVSNTALITATALPSYIVTKEVDSYNAVNKTITWKIILNKIIDQYSCLDTIGLWGLTNIVMQDSIPTGGVFVSASDGGMETSPGSGKVQWVMNPSTVNWCYWNYYYRTVTVQYPSIPYGTWIDNYAKLKGKLVGNVDFTMEATKNYRLLAPAAGAGCVDLYNNSIFGVLGAVGDSANVITFPFSNLGNVILDHVRIEIPIPDQIQANQILYLTTATSNVYYVTNNDPVNEIQMPRAHYFSDLDTFSRPVLPVGTYIKKYIITYDNVLPSSTYYFSLSGFKILPIDRNGNPVIPSYPYLPQIPCDGVGTCITFGSNVSYTYNSTSYSTSCYLGIMPKSKAPDINTVEKKVLNPKFFVPGDTIEFRLSFYNSGDSVLNGVITDTLAPQFQFVPNSWSTWSYYPIASKFKPVLVQNGQILRFEYFGDSNKIGIYNCLKYKVVIRNNVPPSIYYNKFYLKADNIPNPLPLPYYWFPAFYGTAAITVNAVTSVTADKGVKGILDNKFLFYPTNASTINGSDVDYKLRVNNQGNTKLINTVLVDDLPYKNDSRGSQFTPYMTSLPSFNQPNVSVFYSLDSNVCITEITPPISSAGCITPTWTSFPPSDLKKIKALKFLMSDSLAGGDSLIVTWKMSAPANLNAGDVAYNKFDYQSRQASNNAPLLTTSPNKVGIVVSYLAQVGEYIWLDINRNGIRDELPSNGLNGILVGLWQSGTDHLPNTSDDIFIASTTTSNNLSGEPGYYKFVVVPGDYFIKFTIDSCLYGQTSTLTSANFTTPLFTLAPAQIDFGKNLGLAPNFLSVSGISLACVGSNALFTSTLNAAYPTWKYQWQKSTNGTTWIDLSASTSSSFTISTVSYSDSAYYRLTAIHLSNCTLVSNPVKLGVGSGSSGPVVVPFTPICPQNGLMTLSATGSNLVWYTTSVGGLGSTFAPIIDLSVPSTVTYFVGQSGVACFTGIVPLPVEIWSNPVPPLPVAYAPFCLNNGFVTLSATGSNLVWYTSSIGGISSSLPIAVNLGVPQTVTYFVSQTVNGCTSSRTPLPIEVVSSIAPLTNAFPVICASVGNITLTAVGNNLTWYTTSIGGVGSISSPTVNISTPSTVVYFVSQKTLGCESPRAEVKIQIVDSIIVTLTANTPQCIGDTLKLLTSALGSYLWKGPSGFSSSISNPEVIIQSNSQVGLFTLTVTNGLGCRNSKAIFISTVVSLPQVLLNDVSICKGQPLAIHSNASLIGYWVYPGGTILGNNISFASTSYSLSGIYDFVQGIGNCKSKKSIQVDIRNCPPVAMEDAYETMCDDTLYLMASRSPIVNDFDPNQQLTITGFSLLTQPQHGIWHTFSNGTSSYQLTTKNFEGVDQFQYKICDSDSPRLCDTTTITINVKCHTIFFPNAFSPNGDGKNDLYEVFYVPYGVQIAIQFYNRWGELVYQSEDYKNDWYGKSNTGVKVEDELPSGTYFMVANASNGAKSSKYVVLIR